MVGGCCSVEVVAGLQPGYRCNETNRSGKSGAKQYISCNKMNGTKRKPDDMNTASERNKKSTWNVDAAAKKGMLNPRKV